MPPGQHLRQCLLYYKFSGSFSYGFRKHVIIYKELLLLPCLLVGMPILRGSSSIFMFQTVKLRQKKIIVADSYLTQFLSNDVHFF